MNSVNESWASSDRDICAISYRVCLVLGVSKSFLAGKRFDKIYVFKIHSGSSVGSGLKSDETER